MKKIIVLLLCVLVTGCNAEIDKNQILPANNNDLIDKTDSSSKSDVNEVQDESSESKTELSEDEPKKLKDVIKNEKDQATFDILYDMKSQQFDRAEYQMHIGDMSKQAIITDSSQIESLFDLFTESNVIFMNQNAPTLEMGDSNNSISVYIKLYGMNNDYTLTFRFSGHPNLRFYDDKDSYLIAYDSDTYDRFHKYFSFMNEGVTLLGPGEVGSYDEQLLTIDEDAPLFLDTNDLFHELEQGDDLLLEEFHADPSDRSLIGVLAAFLDEQGQSESVNTRLHMFVEKQSQHDNIKVLDVLLYYTNIYSLENDYLVMLYDKEFSLMKNSELDIYDGETWGELLSKHRDRFWQYQLSIKDTGNDIHELVNASCLNCIPITKIDSSMPFINLYQNSKSYDTKYQYPNNISETIPQFNITSIQAYDCNQKIIQLKGKVYGYKLIEQGDKLILQAIKRMKVNKVQENEMFYFVAAEFTLDTKTLEVKQTQ